MSLDALGGVLSIDTTWEEWAKTLSKSYAQTCGHLNAGRTAEAAKEFAANFLPTVKQMYEQAGLIVPQQFWKMKDWPGWQKQLIALARAADGALKGGQREEAVKLLDKLRWHFYAMRYQAAVMKSNDAIYALRLCVHTDQPEAGDVRQLVADLKKAGPSVDAQSAPGPYNEALKNLLGSVEASLKDGRLTAEETASLRQATDTLYLRFGIQFE